MVSRNANLKRKGQSTLEYVLILTAIVAAIIVVSALVRNNINNSLTHAGSEMENQVNRISFGSTTNPN